MERVSSVEAVRRLRAGFGAAWAGSCTWVQRRRRQRAALVYVQFGLTVGVFSGIYLGACRAAGPAGALRGGQEAAGRPAQRAQVEAVLSAWECWAVTVTHGPQAGFIQQVIKHKDERQTNEALHPWMRWRHMRLRRRRRAACCACWKLYGNRLVSLAPFSPSCLSAAKGSHGGRAGGRRSGQAGSIATETGPTVIELWARQRDPRRPQ